MTKTFAFAAIAATLSFAAPALAQAPASGAAAPVASDEPAEAAARSAPASGANTAASAGAEASVTTGMSVKDNTGVVIGEVSDVKAGLATIKMGADSFTVDTSKLGVANGAATINASQADIRGMLKKK